MTSITTPSVQQLIEAVNQADSATQLLETVEDLAAVQSPEAIPTLIEVLGFNNPGASVAATEGLINIGEPVIEPLLNSLDDYNYGARAWSLRVFAGIGDIRALELIIKAATSDFSMSVRRAATKGLGKLQWHQLATADIKPTQRKILQILSQTCRDEEWVVRYSAIVGLESLAQSLTEFNHPDLLPQIQEQLNYLLNHDPEIVILSRAKLALAIIEAQ